MLTERIERIQPVECADPVARGHGSMILVVALLLAWLGFAGCAAQHDDAWILELRARESADQTLQAVGSEDGSFASQVPAAAGSIDPGAEADYVTLGIGGDTPIECALYHDEVEAASTLQTSAAQVFNELAEKYGAVVRANVERLDAGAIGSSPFLQLYWSYVVPRAEGEVLGELKQMIASREGRSIYCVLHDNGYPRTFDNVFRQLVANMRFSSYDQLRPYFTQIHVLSVDGQRFGFVTTSVTLEEDGEPRVVRYTAEMRTANGAMSARDITTVEHSTVSGMLRGKVFTDFQNGEVASALALQSDGGEGWTVSGERGGVTMQSALASPDLWSWLGGSGVLRQVVAGDAADAGILMWEPQVSSDREVERRYSRLDSLPQGLSRVSVQTGDEQSVAAVGNDGLIRSETNLGQSPSVLRERVYVEGALR